MFGNLKNGNACTNKAYYLENDLILCGLHSFKNRIKLPFNPHTFKLKEEENKDHMETIIQASQQNLESEKMRSIYLGNLGMMRAPQHLEGFLSIFPNFKHGNRKDGLGIPALSPISLGSVNHHMPQLPSAQNLDNYYQGSKFYPVEDARYLEVRRQMYLSQTPYRHKF